jgi:hypothetical protein
MVTKASRSLADALYVAALATSKARCVGTITGESFVPASALDIVRICTPDLLLPRPRFPSHSTSSCTTGTPSNVAAHSQQPFKSADKIPKTYLTRSASKSITQALAHHNALADLGMFGHECLYFLADLLAHSVDDCVRCGAAEAIVRIGDCEQQPEAVVRAGLGHCSHELLYLLLRAPVRVRNARHCLRQAWQQLVRRNLRAAHRKVLKHLQPHARRSAWHVGH